MEKEKLDIMIERFFNAELSVEEERELCCYLREHDVPAELRKDKEAIIALCGEEHEAVLPSGAEMRLEAMLDTLAEVEVPDVSDERDAGGAKRRIFKIPRLVWHGAAAVALLAVGYIFMDENVQSHEKQQTVVAEFAEEDTFDNPEDAMECFKGAFENMMLVVNTTHKNSRKMENTLKDAVAPYKEIIKINIQ